MSSNFNDSSNKKKLIKIIKSYNRRDYENTLRELSKLTYGSDMTSRVHKLTALCYLHLDNFELAERYIDKAINNNPYDETNLLMDAYRNLKRDRVTLGIHIYTRLVSVKRNKKAKVIIKKLKNNSVKKIINSNKISFFIPIRLKLDYWNNAINNNKNYISLSIKKKHIQLLIKIFNKKTYNQMLYPIRNILFNIPSLFIKNKKKKLFLIIALMLFLFTFIYIKKNPDLFKPLIMKVNRFFLKKNEEIKNKNLFIHKVNNVNLLYKNWKNNKEKEKTIEIFSQLKSFIVNNKINEAITLYNEVILNKNSSIKLKKQFEKLILKIPPMNLSFFKKTNSISKVITDNKYLETYVIINGRVKLLKTSNKIQLLDIDDKKIKSVFIQIDKEDRKKLINDQSYQFLVRYDGFNKKTKDILLIKVDFKLR